MKDGGKVSVQGTDHGPFRSKTYTSFTYRIYISSDTMDNNQEIEAQDKENAKQQQ